MNLSCEELKSKLVIKAVRNVRRGYEKDESSRGMYRSGVKLDIQRSKLLTESYKMTEGEPMIIRRAKALEHILLNMDIYIQEWEKIVGNNVPAPNKLYFGIDMNWRSVKRVVNGEEGKELLNDAEREELKEMIDYWKGKSMSDIHQQYFHGDILKYWKYDGTILWTHWSELGIPNYEKIFKIGLKGIIKKTEDKMALLYKTVPHDFIEQIDFLKAVIISLNAVINYAKRYSELASKIADNTTDEEDRNRLLHIAAICKRVPEEPPQSLHEALQSFFFIHIVRYIEYSTLGIGIRFDKIFGPYLKKDLNSNKISEENASELLQLLWVKFHELGLIYSPMVSMVYGGVASLQAITIGGLDDNGNDITNGMTYLVLETAKKMRTLEPSIVFRYHDDTPRKLLSMAIDVVHTGIGYPSFFNDKSIIPLLEKWGTPKYDALDYAVTGCVYLEIPGKNIVRRAYGGIGLLKCLWWALHQGRDPFTGEQHGAPTPDPRTFISADDLFNAYIEQVRFFFHKLNTIENTSRVLYEKYLPRPYYSALLDGCIEQGKESRKWCYQSMVHDVCILAGTSNVADSIAAVKKVIFEEKQITMDELLEALHCNWEGYERVRQLMLNAPKYGNDDDYADSIAVEVHYKTSEVLAEFKNRFGIPCRGDGSAVSATYGAAISTPATPDGRKNGEPYADATLSPVQNMDKKGPTAVLKSASKIDTLKTYNHLLNQKFLPSNLNGEMKDIFIDYLRSWGDLNISHIQFNIVDRDTLIKAQQEPDKYSDLIVRVAGYSAYFIDLSKGLQDSIIARTEQKF